MSGPRPLNGRRALREELQSTWNVYDAVRPIRRGDMESAEPPQPEAAQPAPEASESPHGGTLRLVTGHGVKTVTLANPEDVARFETASDGDLAALFGINEMDVREARKWARENTERLGTVTVTGIDTDAGVLTVKH